MSEVFSNLGETAKVTLSLPCTEHVQFTLKSTIKNGPIPGFSRFAAAVVDSELRLNEGYQENVKNWLGTGALLTSHTTFTLFGQEGESRVSLPEFNAVRLSWGGMALRIKFSKDLSHYSLQGDIPRMELNWGDRYSWKISGLHYEGDQKQVFSDDPALYSGTRELVVEHLEFNSRDQGAGTIIPPSITAKEIKANDASTLIGNEFIDDIEKSSAQTFEVYNQNYGPIRFDVSLNHLHARTLSDLRRNNGETMSKSPVVVPLPQVISLQELVKTGMEVKIDRLSFTTPQGEALFSSSIKIINPEKIDFTDPRTLARNFNIKMDVSLPEEFIRVQLKKYGPIQTEEQVSAKIQDAIAHGYVTRNGEMLKCSIEFKNNQVLFNGNLFVPPSHVASENPNAEQPQLTRTLNCVACHAVDHKVIGPSWIDVAKRYRGATHFEYNGYDYPLIDGLVMKVSRGGSGHWGNMPMPANDPLGSKKPEITELVKNILSMTGYPEISRSEITNAPIPKAVKPSLTDSYNFAGTSWRAPSAYNDTIEFRENGLVAFKTVRGYSYGQWKVENGVLRFDNNNYSHYEATIDGDWLVVSANNPRTRWSSKWYRADNEKIDRQIKKDFDQSIEDFNKAVEAQRLSVLGESPETEAILQKGKGEQYGGKHWLSLCDDTNLRLKAIWVATSTGKKQSELCYNWYGTRHDWKESILKEGCLGRCRP